MGACHIHSLCCQSWSEHCKWKLGRRDSGVCLGGTDRQGGREEGQGRRGREGRGWIAGGRGCLLSWHLYSFSHQVTPPEPPIHLPPWLPFSIDWPATAGQHVLSWLIFSAHRPLPGGPVWNSTLRVRGLDLLPAFFLQHDYSPLSRPAGHRVTHPSYAELSSQIWSAASTLPTNLLEIQIQDPTPPDWVKPWGWTSLACWP